MAHYPLRFLQKDMLLLWDRNFLSTTPQRKGNELTTLAGSVDHVDRWAVFFDVTHPEASVSPCGVANPP
jgi:hypothetical protein